MPLYPRRSRRRCAFTVLLTAVALAAVPATAHAREGRMADASPTVVGVSTLPDPVPAGSTTQLRVQIVNTGPDTTAEPFRIDVHLPDSSVFVPGNADSTTRLVFPPNCTAGETAQDVACSFPAGLPSLDSAIVLLPVQVSEAAPPGVVLAGGRVTVDCAGPGYPFEIAVDC
ncbi:hypothetical protein [Streptomyces sp. S.PB5]|uniref:hypothetical protein n=1 Tax=Streptomyces sp. S.PB5 TaxID=3020844 RepID=UPI0025B1CC94|nr:hypothetical protein [Streptomyces sp. S.PB5]MDN3022783.1 hypothetical protein [Streptomyces sp. S.PB5]